jgi:hypothetical protein
MLKGLFEGHKINCFWSGLRDEIRLVMRMLNPLTLNLLKRDSSLTLTMLSLVVQFISHGQSSSLNAYFEIELGPLDFNKPSLLVWPRSRRNMFSVARNL